MITYKIKNVSMSMKNPSAQITLITPHHTTQNLTHTNIWVKYNHDFSDDRALCGLSYGQNCDFFKVCTPLKNGSPIAHTDVVCEVKN